MRCHPILGMQAGGGWEHRLASQREQIDQSPFHHKDSTQITILRTGASGTFPIEGKQETSTRAIRRRNGPFRFDAYHGPGQSRQALSPPKVESTRFRAEHAESQPRCGRRSRRRPESSGTFLTGGSEQEISARAVPLRSWPCWFDTEAGPRPTEPARAGGTCAASHGKAKQGNSGTARDGRKHCQVSRPTVSIASPNVVAERFRGRSAQFQRPIGPISDVPGIRIRRPVSSGCGTALAFVIGCRGQASSSCRWWIGELSGQRCLPR